MFTRLVNECLDRTGRRVMFVSIVLGALAGLGLSQIVRLTAEFWTNVGLWILIGSTVAFLIDLLFVSPIRLLREQDAELVRLRNRPPDGMQIGHIDTQVNVQLAAGGTFRFAASSNTLIVGPDQEGVLFPRGTLIRRDWAEHLRLQDAWGAEVTRAAGDISFVPPDLLGKPPEPPDK